MGGLRLLIGIPVTWETRVYEWSLPQEHTGTVSRYYQRFAVVNDWALGETFVLPDHMKIAEMG